MLVPYAEEGVNAHATLTGHVVRHVSPVKQIDAAEKAVDEAYGSVEAIVVEVARR